MNISNKGINLIKGYEGLRTHSYQCSANVWTIGYGHTKNIKPNMIISLDQAEEFLKEDLEKFEVAVNKAIKVELTQNIYDSLVSLAFNIGIDAFSKSTLVKLINNGKLEDKPIIRNEWLKWNKIKGVPSIGLTNRRMAELKNMNYL